MGGLVHKIQNTGCLWKRWRPQLFATAEMKCPLGWDRHQEAGKMCFKEFTTQKTCGEARDFCTGQGHFGGHLASIHNYETNEWLANKITSHLAWIGALRHLGHFVWHDGSDWDFSFWNKGEPNNSNGNEVCTELMKHRNALWNDRINDYKIGFICQTLPVI